MGPFWGEVVCVVTEGTHCLTGTHNDYQLVYGESASMCFSGVASESCGGIGSVLASTMADEYGLVSMPLELVLYHPPPAGESPSSVHNSCRCNSKAQGLQRRTSFLGVSIPASKK